MKQALTALSVGILLTWTFIDLEVAADIGGWHANAPVVDIIALVLLPLALLGWRRDPVPLPAPRAYAALLVVALLSALTSDLRGVALHFWLRKMAFVYLVYGIGLSWVVARRIPAGLLQWSLVGWLGLNAVLSLVTSGLRIASGAGLWADPLPGLTPNHKTIAVAIAGALPLFYGLLTAPGTDSRVRKALPWALLVGVAAVAASLSKTAWIAAAVGIAAFVPRDRPLLLRKWLVVPGIALALAAAWYLPILVGSKSMLDATRARHSINKRGWLMFERSPLLGSGPGLNVHVEAATFPDYRVNGVDAHGVVQKIGSETGLLGLGAYGIFAIGSGVALRRRATTEGAGLRWAAFGTWASLNTNLLLSTETFSPTHWVPFAVAWGLSCRKPGEPS